MKDPAQDRLEAIREFQTSLNERLTARRRQSPEERVLTLFHGAAQSVPAYQEFLGAQGIEASSVVSVEEFQRLPLMTKENYMRAYSLPDRCWGGRLEECEMVAVSSGSTGTPMFWPRTSAHELEIATRFEQIFHDSFGSPGRTSLAVICFTMGTWVGGMFTATCCRYVAHKGYPITLVTPGNNRDEIFRCVTELGPYFDQVVLLGYPPFLKDVIDTGRTKGIDWAPFRVKLVMAGEVFSEEWRTLIGQRLGSTDHAFDSASLYGTADAGVLGNETPLSITIRRFLAQQPEAARELFGESRLPTLVQYDPSSRYFEVHDRTLLFSGDNRVPLIRYHIADSGGIISFAEMMAFLAGQGFDPRLEVTDRAPVREMPFVYVFGRSDFTVSYFGANIYPENVTVGLEAEEISGWVSGKFVLMVVEDADRNRRLSVVVELLPGAASSPEREGVVASSIHRHLLRLNSEFAHYVPPEYQMPQVTLRPTGDPEYFPVGVKHRYTRRQQAT